MDVKSTFAEGDVYVDPFVGPANHSVQILIDVSGLTSDEIDSEGYLKPGVPFRENGLLISGASQYVFGVTREAVRVGYDSATLTWGNAAAHIAGGTDTQVALFTIGQVDKGAIEDNLARSLTVNEVDGFESGSCEVILVDRSLNT